MSDAGRALSRALVARGGEGSRIIEASARSWASILFEGARHIVHIELPLAAADLFADGIDEAQFILPGHILADIEIVERATHDDTVRIRLEVLTLIDA